MYVSSLYLSIKSCYDDGTTFKYVLIWWKTALASSQQFRCYEKHTDKVASKSLACLSKMWALLLVNVTTFCLLGPYNQCGDVVQTCICFLQKSDFWCPLCFQLMKCPILMCSNHVLITGDYGQRAKRLIKSQILWHKFQLNFISGIVSLWEVRLYKEL